MIIADVREKCKSQLAKVPRDMLILAILVLASSASFGLGYMAGSERPNADVDWSVEPKPGNASSTATSAAGRVLASKGGTKYYYPSCAGASRITDANKVWFVSASAAEEAGYTLAANCKEN